MSRTTLDLETTLLKELKDLQKKERKSLGRLVSELVTEALARRRRESKSEQQSFQWISRPMDALMDYSDKEVLYAVLDSADHKKKTTEGEP